MAHSDSSEDERPYNPRDDWEPESDEDSLRPNKRRKTAGSTTLRTRGLAFVQRSAEDDHDAQDAEHNEDEDDYDDMQPSMGLGMGSSTNGIPAFGFGQYPTDTATRSPSPAMMPSPEPEKKIGAGESAFGRGGKVNQNSFAARMMAKMGHKEGQGLGRSGQGIAAPIQTQKVQVGTGLGFGAQEHRPRISTKTLNDRKVGTLSGKPAAARLKAPPRKKYEVAAIESRGLHVPDALKNIIDATGAENKTLDSLSGYSTPTSEASRPLTEVEKKEARLKQDLKLFADAWDGQVAEAEALDQELTQRQADVEEYTKQVQLFQNMISSLESVAIDETLQGRPFDQVITRLQEIQQSYAEYIHPLDLPDLAIASLLAPLQLLLADWNPEDDLNTAVNLVSQLQCIAPLIDLDRTIKSRHRRRTTPLESLLLQTLYPKIRGFLRSDWHPYDPLPAINLLNTLYPALLPPWMMYKLLEEIVIPRLVDKIRKFKKKSSSSRKHNLPDLHLWLFDWWILFESLDVESFHALKIEIKSKVRFDESAWPKWEPLLGSRHKPSQKAPEAIDLPSSAANTPREDRTETEAELEQITFRDILEEWCAENDLMLRNTGTSDELGRRLQRLNLAGGKGQGMLIYVQNDVVFDAGTDDPYGLDEELVGRVRTGK